jgi:hypothetical protein
MPAALEKLLRRITPKKRPGRTLKESRIAIAKSRGFIRQKGAHLSLTAKGKKAAAKI